MSPKQHAVFKPGRDWDTCCECGGDFRLTYAGRLRSHGPANARCQGGGRYGLVVRREIAERARSGEVVE